MNEDIRWKQRLQNYEQALKTLKDAVDLFSKRDLSGLEKQGVIQSFEFTHELAWNLLKDYFQFQGNTQITGSRDAAREAFHKGIIVNGDTWMEMIKSRNKTSHTYNESIADEIVVKIRSTYTQEFIDLYEKMKKLSENE